MPLSNPVLVARLYAWRQAGDQDDRAACSCSVSFALLELLQDSIERYKVVLAGFSFVLSTGMSITHLSVQLEGPGCRTIFVPEYYPIS